MDYGLSMLRLELLVSYIQKACNAMHMHLKSVQGTHQWTGKTGESEAVTEYGHFMTESAKGSHRATS